MSSSDFRDSFKEFNVGEGLEIYFANPEGIANIFSRITGNNISEIFGTLGVEGAANLFLINPNGIVFGENTIVDVGGSFIATTAEKVEFEDGKSFDARRRDKPLLTWDAPVGLSYNEPGNIQINGASNDLRVEVPSFRVIENSTPNGIKFIRGNSISLLGGNISSNGGGITAEGKNIQIGSVEDGSEVGLQKAGSLWLANYEQVTDFGNIQLKNGAYLNASGNTAGAIFLDGQQISIEDSSAIISNTFVDSSSTNNAINIKASESVKLFGNLEMNTNSVSLISADVLSNATGNGIDINVETNRLEVYDGAEIRAVNFADSGRTGKINIEAEQIQVTGIKLGTVETTDNTSVDGGLNSLITTSTGIGSGGGNGNIIKIDTNTLEVFDGGSIKVDTFGFGQAGNLEINAQQIKLSGINELLPERSTGLQTSLPSSARVQNDFNGTIRIDTEILEITEGAVIKTATGTFGNTAAAGNIDITAKEINLIGFNTDNLADVSGLFTTVGATSLGNAGNINIKTDSLNILDGARIQADSGGIGGAGNVNITAGQINLSGERPARGLFRSGITTSAGRNSNSGGNILLDSDRIIIQNGSSINAFARGSGNGGNVTLKAGEIEIGGADSYGLGLFSGIFTNSAQAFGGNIALSSARITLTDGGSLSAFSSAGNGGNVSLNSSSIELFDSDITASAGGEGNGGNVNINTDTILGINSDVTATAVFGNGGNIKITADGVIGLEEGKAIANNQTSEVDASSQFGQDGTVTINNPQTNTSNPLVAFQTPLPQLGLFHSRAKSCKLI